MKINRLFIVDGLTVCFGMTFATWLVEGSVNLVVSELLLLIALSLLVYSGLLYGFKMHQAPLETVSVKEGMQVFGVNISACVSMIIVVILVPSLTISVQVLIIGFFIITLIMSWVRFSKRGLAIFKPRQGKRALIYGANYKYSDLVNYHDYQIIGFVDDNPALKGLRVWGLPVLGGGDDLETLVALHRIDHLILALPNLSDEDSLRLVNQVRKSKVESVSVLTAMTLTKPEKHTDNIDISQLLNRREVVLDVDDIQEHIDNQTILVTGAGGSIGSELVRQLVKYRPKKVVLLDIHETGLYQIEQELRFQYQGQDMPISAIIGSIRDREKVFDLFRHEHFDIVFHAAAHKHVPLMETSPQEAIKNNIFGTQNLIDASIETDVKKFVNISSDKAVNPTNVMGATKRFIEMMLQSERCMKASTQFVAVRFGNVLGSNGSVIPLFVDQIEKGGPVTVTDPNIVRYFMTIPEAVSLVLQASCFARGGEIFVLDMGKPVKISDLAERLIRMLGYEPFKEIDIDYVGLRPGEKLYEELIMHEEGLHKTRNDLIFVASPVVWQDCVIQQALNQLQHVYTQKDAQHIKQVLAQVVHTYSAG